MQKQTWFFSLIIQFFGLSLAFALMPLAAWSFQQPVVGREAAQKYFQTEQSYASPGKRVLSLHLGNPVSSKAYAWNKDGEQLNVAVSAAGVTYKYGEWTNSMDLNLRLDYLQYEIEGGRPAKLSILGAVTFPDIESRFPLYFGAALGPGVYFVQMGNESNISLDYQVFLGARFTELFGSGGFFIEAGTKDHIHITSDGQVMSSFVSLGLVFIF